MAVGKNKRLTRGKKGAKKKVVDVMTRKDWYDVRAPSYFATRTVGKTLVTRTTGLKIASEGLKGRVFEINLADLNNDESAYRKMRLISEDVQGRNVLTNFHGMTFTTDKLRSLVRKWQSLIEASTDVKTSEGYVLRLFCIGFTRKRQNQVKKTCYAQSSQKAAIRAKMVEIIERESNGVGLKELVVKLMAEGISKEIEKACRGIYPLHDVHIRKVKVLKKPKFELARLMEVHGDVSSVTDEGVVSSGAGFNEPAPLESV